MNLLKKPYQNFIYKKTNIYKMKKINARTNSLLKVLLKEAKEEVNETEELAKYGIKELQGNLNLEKLKSDYPWVLKAKMKNAVLQIDGGKLTFNEGTWISGTWEDGYWIGGTWKDGTWLNGTFEQLGNRKSIWENGTFKNGIFSKATWKNGTFRKGTWKDGTWMFGEFRAATWENGIWKGGRFEWSNWLNGTFEKGWIDGNSTWENGTFAADVNSMFGGKFNGGVFKSGAFHGEFNGGTFKGGTFYGKFKDGIWEDGIIKKAEIFKIQIKKSLKIGF